MRELLFVPKNMALKLNGFTQKKLPDAHRDTRHATNDTHECINRLLLIRFLGQSPSCKPSVKHCKKLRKL